MKSPFMCSLSLGILAAAHAPAQPPPYPPSPVLTGLTLDWSTHRRAAPGSDNFQLVWADDNHQYGWWGDGGGFGGATREGRVGLGFARIEGGWDNWRGFNVWGGKTPENPAQFDGKSWGTISVDGMLYSWIVPDVPDTGGPRNHYRYIELARSTDHGAAWAKAPWRWRIEDDPIIPTFLNFAPKWFSDDGQAFTLTFTGGGRGKDNDSFNTVRGRFAIYPEQP